MENNKILIRLEEEKDYREVENLVRDSFFNIYCPGAKEHYVLHMLRDDPNFIKDLDFVMELNDEIIGQIVFVKSNILLNNGETKEVLTFGPICIANEYKRKGYGKILLDYAINESKKLGTKALIINGNIMFYGKSGFEIAKNKGIRYAFDLDADYLLVKELEKGYLDNISGIYKDPECYFVCEKYPEDFEKFESSFPEKEKVKLEGQIFNK